MGAVPPQQPKPSSRPVPARSPSSASADAWKASMGDELLHGKPLQQDSPDVAAAVPREDLYSTLEEAEGDIDVDYADEGSAQSREVSGRNDGARHPQHRFPVMMPGSSLATIAVPPIPTMSSIAGPTSPMSLSSSIATDTPRSILRQSGSASGRTPQSSSRRISFVGVSPPRLDEPHDRRHGKEENEGDSDDYESAEPSLRYDIVTLTTPVNGTPPRHARSARSLDSSSPNSDYHSQECNEDPSRRASSPVPAPQQQWASSSLSPERPRLSSRSRTHSPPRGSGGGYTSRTGLPLSTPVAVPSAPPSPEEEGDEITLDVAPQHRVPALQNLTQGPDRRIDQRRARSPSMETIGHDDDVLTQPHNRSETEGVADVAAVVRRPPPRQRWPSDAYQDDPPTEVSIQQRGRQSRRERLDPEDDMDSSSSSQRSNDNDSLSTGSDDSLSARYASPLKAHQEEQRGLSHLPTSSSPPVPAFSAHKPRAGSPTPRRHSANSTENSDRTSSSSRGSTLSQRRTSRVPSSATPLPPLQTQQDNTYERNLGNSSHEHNHGRSSRAVTSAFLSTSHNRSCGMLVGEENRGQDNHANSGAPPPYRETSLFSSTGYSPSTITGHSSDRSVAGDLSGFATAAAAPEPRRMPFRTRRKHHGYTDTSATVLKNYQQQHEVIPSVLSAVTTTEQSKQTKDRQAAGVVEGDVSQVYVDPLLRERRHRHELARQESLPHQEQHSLSAKARSTSSHVEQPHRRHSRPHARRRSPCSERAANRQPATYEPVSLRDIMKRHDSPTTKSRRGTSFGQSTTGVILHPPSEVRQLHLQRSSHDNDGAAHGLKLGAAAMEASVKSSSLLSSGGVPADELLWDTSTLASHARSSPPPSVSSRFSSERVLNTPGGRKVLRKKLVVVVRRKKTGAVPSENDPVMQMSLLPFKEGAAALLESNSLLQGSPQQQRRARSASLPAAAAAPVLEKLIDHMGQSRCTSMSSRFPSRVSQRQCWSSSEAAHKCDGGDYHASEDEISEADRRQFRQALSELSFRSASRRSFVSPSTTTTALRSHSSHTRSPHSQHSVPHDRERPRHRSHRSHSAAMNDTVTSVRTTSPSHERSSRGDSCHSNEKSAHRCNGGYPHNSRRRHKHESRRHSSVEHRRRSLSPATIPGARYCATQNEEFYSAAHMAKDGAALVLSPLVERIGITPMSMQVLPRLVLRSEIGVSPQRQYNHDLHSNIDAFGHTNGAWSASDDEGEHTVVRVFDAKSDGLRSRPLLLQFSSGTQTDEAAGATLAFGSARSGMPLLVAAPVQRLPAVGPKGNTRNSAHSIARKIASIENIASTVKECAATSSPVSDASASESPASFVKRAVSPTAAAEPFTSSTSHIHSSYSGEAGGGATKVFRDNVGVSKTSTDVPLSTSAPPLSVAPVHMTATHSQLIIQHPDTAASATMGTTASVPLFMPPLMVDDLSQLSHEWQSTLHERTSKAKQDAVEKFLIASAEAGAASTEATVAAAASLPPLCLAGSVVLGENSNMYASGCAEPRVPAVGAEASFERQGCNTSTQAHQGLALQEFYGGSVASAAIPSVSLSAYAIPPRSGPRSFLEIERDVQQRSGSSQSAVQQATGQQQQEERSLSLFTPSKAKYMQETLVARELASGGKAAAVKSRGSGEASFTAATKHSGGKDRGASSERLRANSNGPRPTKSFDLEAPSTVEANDTVDVVDIVQPPLPTDLLSAPSTLAEAEEQARRGNRTCSSSSSSRQRSRSVVEKETPAEGTIAAATSGVGVHSALPLPSFFSVVEPATEAHTSHSVKKAAKHRSGNRHRRNERRKHSSHHGTSASSRRSPSPSSSEASKLHSTKRNKKSKEKKSRYDGDDKHKKRKHGHERHGRCSRSCTRSRSSRAGDATFFEMSDDSEVDSNLTTSMEFQLSRLLLLREAASVKVPTPTAASGASRRSKHDKEKENRKAAAAKKGEHHHHRNRSAKAKKRKMSSKRGEKRRRTLSAGSTVCRISSGTEKKKKTGKEKVRHRSASPPNPWPLPPPPPRQHSNALYGVEATADDAAAGGAVDAKIRSAALRSDWALRYRSLCDDHATLGSPRSILEDHTQSRSRYQSTRPSFRGGSLYTGDQEEGVETDRARHHTKTRAGEDSEMLYGHYRRYSHNISPLRGQRPYVASAASRWADGARRAYRPALRADTTVEESPLQHRSHSDPSRPSMRWGDYVRGAERGAAGGPLSPFYTHTGRPQSLAQRRRSRSIDTITGGACSNGGGEGYSRASAQPTSSTCSATYTSRRRQTGEFDHIDDLPIRQYFNKEAVRKSDVKEDNPLVSTPTQDGAEEWRPDNARDFSYLRPRERAGKRTPPLPPPPSPPLASTSPPAVQTDSIFAAIPRSGALPILTEYTVTDAQTAEDFVQGVKEIISALQLYRKSV
ncbi:hypothetical protein MNV84_02951 [Leishmania braziliensis]|nr:hypothetical protein MNV84_02951 [Leishmania braziliensis]